MLLDVDEKCEMKPDVETQSQEAGAIYIGTYTLDESGTVDKKYQENKQSIKNELKAYRLYGLI